MQASVEESVARGVGALAASQGRSGMWSDFETLAGPSTEWVTAYVGCALAGAAGDAATTAAERGWAALRRRRRLGDGWGYNRRVPVDGDSTAWALALAERLGVSGQRAALRGLVALQRHVCSDGSVATYRDDGAIRRFTALSRQQSFAGWCSGHVCVTAAAASVEGLGAPTSTIAFLRDAQRRDGTWHGYWWHGVEYPTALVASALAPHDARRVASGCRALANRVDPDGAVRNRECPAGSAFATACVVWALSSSVLDPSAHGARDRAVRWLVGAQLSDGCWSPSAILRIPPPHCTDADSYDSWVMSGGGGGSLVPDKRRLFTTATAVEALSRFMSARVPNTRLHTTAARPT